jgi:hypothetical protein
MDSIIEVSEMGITPLANESEGKHLLDRLDRMRTNANRRDLQG